MASQLCLPCFLSTSCCFFSDTVARSARGSVFHRRTTSSILASGATSPVMSLPASYSCVFQRGPAALAAASCFFCHLTNFFSVPMALYHMDSGEVLAALSSPRMDLASALSALTASLASFLSALDCALTAAASALREATTCAFCSLSRLLLSLAAFHSAVSFFARSLSSLTAPADSAFLRAASALSSLGFHVFSSQSTRDLRRVM
mmetsp:Transcript_31224/g.99567  ORF Transcript_31224/g.99567 Transcript_31224/m.99567 type:complete len:205 (+) Transcript_31224:988-1602(+)